MSSQVESSVARALAGAGVVGLALLAGCGQKGPLVLPAATSAASAPSGPGPAAPSAGPAAMPAPRPATATPAAGSR